MKRRDFLRTAGAAATLPVLPLPAAAAPAVAAPAHAAKLGWAALYARTHAKASPALIQQWLGVGPEQAHALMSELVTQNILRAPVGGAAIAVEPIYTAGGIPGARPVVAQMAQKARKVLDDWVGDLEPDDATPPDVLPDIEAETKDCDTA